MALRAQYTGLRATPPTVTALAGDLIVVSYYERDGIALTFSDPTNGNYTVAVQRGSVVAQAGIAFFQNAAAGTYQVSVTGGSSPVTYTVSVWSSMATTGGADANNNALNSPGTTSHVTGSITPSASATVLRVVSVASSLGSTSGGGTALDIDAGATAGLQYFTYETGVTGATNPTITSANSVVSEAVVAAFLESGGGPPAGDPFITSMTSFVFRR